MHLRSSRGKHRPLHRLKTYCRSLIHSPACTILSWGTLVALVLYRVVMGEWFVLLVCASATLIGFTLQQNWQRVPSPLRPNLLLGSGALLAWVLMTLHAPAQALFFDTLENGLKTLFGRFGVAGVDQIPGWVGAVFRIIAVVFLAVLALRFGRAQEEDSEGVRQIVGKIVQILAGMLILDALIGLFTT